MIYLFTGTPGSGKSLHVAEMVYYKVKWKHPVLCNFEVNKGLFKDSRSFRYVPNESLTPEYLTEYARDYFKLQPFREGQITLVIDECQTIFQSRDWRAADRNDWVTWFTQHRKLGYNVYLVCQYHEMIDKQIRTLVEYEVSHRKVNNVGMFGRVVNVLMVGHPLVCAVTKWYGQKMRLGSDWFVGRKKFYRLYDTLKVFEA